MNFGEKEFLDVEGLKLYTQKILELISRKADVTTVQQEITALKTLIGDVNQLGESYKNIVTALLSEILRAQTAEKELSNTLEWGILGE